MSQKRKGFVSNWWSKEWIKILESFGWTAELAKGKFTPGLRIFAG